MTSGGLGRRELTRLTGDRSCPHGYSITAPPGTKEHNLFGPFRYPGRYPGAEIASGERDHPGLSYCNDWRKLERATRIERATLTLARLEFALQPTCQPSIWPNSVGSSISWCLALRTDLTQPSSDMPDSHAAISAGDVKIPPCTRNKYSRTCRPLKLLARAM